MLVYLDHSALNRLQKGLHQKLLELLQRPDVQVVFSDESLNEISKSHNHEHEFLSFLAALNARLLRLILDERFHCTDRASIDVVDPASAYAAYINNRSEAPPLGTGLVDTLKKFYGGHADRPYSQLVQQDQRELLQVLKVAVDSLPSDKTISLAQIESNRQWLPVAEQEITNLFDTLAQQLDAPSTPASLKVIDAALALGPRVINNIEGPDVVRKVWDAISHQFPEGTMTCEEHFGAIRPRWLAPDEPWTKWQQVNHVYHQLNAAGYMRDENMHRRFDAHFSDLTHVGMASFCQLFLTADQRQALKAAATYEFLGIATMVCHLKNANPEM